MNRRVFVTALAGLPGFARPASAVLLEAVVAPRLPARLLLPSLPARLLRIGVADPRLFELRTYLNPQPWLTDTLARFFPQAALLPSPARSQTSLLIPFDSLAERERAWNLVNAHRLPFDTYRFAIYRLRNEPGPPPRARLRERARPAASGPPRP